MDCYGSNPVPPFYSRAYQAVHRGKQQRYSLFMLNLAIKLTELGVVPEPILRMAIKNNPATPIRDPYLS